MLKTKRTLPFLWLNAVAISTAISVLSCPHAAMAAASTETDCLTRDPSTIVKLGDTFWVYGTGRGVSQFSSKDKYHWTYQGPVFANPPSWVSTAVPENKDGIAWAPDIRLINGTYFLFYSYSTIGSKQSGIGVAFNKTLDPRGWKDQGIVINSGPNTDFNTIDPCIFVDADGAPWLSFGSYFSGIKIIKIDPATGKQAANDRNIYPVAEHPQSAVNSVEASAVYYHDGYYYLFDNWDACCAGMRSTYNIRIGRSRKVTGPYLDKAGKDMMEGGGTLFLGSNPDAGTGLPFDDEVGPGHAAIFTDTDGDWFSCHYEGARDKGGATTLNVMKLTWTAEGWPSVQSLSRAHSVPSGLTYKISNQDSNLHLYAAGPELFQQTDDGTKAEVWRIDDAGNGYFTITNVESGLALEVPANAKRGEKIKLTKPASDDAHLWKIESTTGGYYNFTNKGSGFCLDNPGGSLDVGEQIGQWSPNDLAPQHWRLEIQADDQGVVSGAQYKLVNAAGGLCADDPSGSHKIGETIGNWTDNNLMPQRWRIETAKSGGYKIISQESGLCLSSVGPNNAGNSMVYQMPGDDSKAQTWKIVRNPDGFSTIENAATGKLLETENKPGAKLMLRTKKVSGSTRWRIIRK